MSNLFLVFNLFSRSWQQHLHAVLLRFGLRQANNDPCLFFFDCMDEHGLLHPVLIMIIMVDGMLVAFLEVHRSIFENLVIILRKNVHRPSDIKTLGPASSFGGYLISRVIVLTRNFISLN